MRKIKTMITICAITGSILTSTTAFAQTITIKQPCNNSNVSNSQINPNTYLDYNNILNCIKSNNTTTPTSNKSVKAATTSNVNAKKCKKVKVIKKAKNCNTTATKATTSTAAKKPATTNTTNTSTNTTNNTSTSNTTSGNYKDFQKRVIDLVNKERAAAGLKALSENTAVDKTATLKSEDMAKLNYFSHTSPTYGSPFDMMKQFGIQYTAAGENIAMGQSSPEEVMNGWMNSAGHRANILNSNFTQIGVGIAKNAKGQLYWTQQFIR